MSLLTVAVVLVMGRLLPPEVPLFYGKPVGEGQLTSTLGLSIGPAVSLLVLGINIVISFLLSNTFTRKVLIISAFVVSLLIAITVVKIVFLVGFF
jgi:hypothetical protein